MIRVFITSWVYSTTEFGRIASNPVFDYVNTLPAAENIADAIEVSVIASPSTNGVHDKSTCLVIMNGGNSIADLVIDGARKLQSFNFDQQLDVLSADEVVAIRSYFSDYTDLNVDAIDSTYTYGQSLHAIAKEINPAFKSFGDHYEANKVSWE